MFTCRLILSVWILVYGSRSTVSIAEDNDAVLIAVGLPKSGSRSVWNFLNNCCGRFKAVHMLVDNCKDSMYPVREFDVENHGIIWNQVEKSHVRSDCYIAVQLQRALVDGKKPLEYVLQNGINAVIQLDAEMHDLNIWPQIDALERILIAYPNAMYIHHVRNITNQVSSIMRWYDLSTRLERKGMLNRFPGQSSNLTREANIALMIQYSQELVREAFRYRPHYKYIEINIESDPMSGPKLSKFVGAPQVRYIANVNRNDINTTRAYHKMLRNKQKRIKNKARNRFRDVAHFRN